MKKTHKIYFFLLLSIFANYQIHGQNWITSQVIKGSNIEPRYSAVDKFNNIFILAQFSDTILTPFNLVSYGSNDLILFKINPEGSILWYNRIGNISNDIAGGITIDNSNSIYISGAFSSICKFTNSDSLVSTGNTDIFLAKYNESGNYQWSKNIGSSSTVQTSSDLRFDGSSKLLITGIYRDSLIIGNPSTIADTLLGNSFISNFIAVFDLNGEIQWAKKILGSSNLSRFKRIDISNNGYYFGGFFQAQLFLDIGTITSYVANTFDAFIYKTDFDGNGQWVRRIRGTGTENFRTLTTDEYDNVYVLGNYNSPTIYVDSTETITKTLTGNMGGYDTFIGKYNRSGVLQWFLRKGSTAKDIYNDFVVRNNVIYATGFFTNQIIFNTDTLRTSSSSNSDAFLAAFNEIGDPIAGVSIVGTGNYEDAGTIVNMDANSRAYVSGYYKSQQIKIGSQIYTSNNVNKSDLFFAIYQQPFKAVITNEKMVSCNGLSDGMLQATPYFGKPPFSYAWSHNANLHDPKAENLPAGVYTVTITDANNASASKTDTVFQPQPLVITPLITPVSCNSENDGAIDITVTGGTKHVDYSYYWTSLNGSGVQPLQQDQTGLTDGTYSILIKDDNLCTSMADFVVTEPDPIHFTGTAVTDFTFPPGNNGAVDLHIAGGNIPYSFAWTGPGSFAANTEDINSLATGGLYSVALTDNKGCTADTGVSVNDGTTFIAQITAKTDVLCFGDDNGTATVSVLNGVEPYSFHWSDGLVTPLAIRTNMAPGTYQVLVEDASLPTPHTAQAQVVINGPASALNLVISGQDLRCYNDTSGVVNLSVTGGTLPYRYLWNDGYTGEDQVNVIAGQYSVTVTDTNNCIAQKDIEITQPDIFALTIEITREILCHGDRTGELSANATGGMGTYSYLWDDQGTQITQTAVQLSADTYKVKVTDQNNCSVSGSRTIGEPDTLSVQSVILTNPACTGEASGSIVPTMGGGTPPLYFVWSNNIITPSNLNIPAGTYTLTVTDQNNCTLNQQEFTLNDPLPIMINLIDSTNVSCFGMADGSVTVDASGGTGILKYSADNGQNFSDSPTIGSLEAGFHTVMVKDSNDCISDGYPVTIGQPAEIIFDLVTTTDATCFGIADGSVTIDASGGTGILKYSADNGQSFSDSSTIDSLRAGAYSVVVKDSSNCISNAYSVTINQPDEILFDTVTATDANCFGYSDGSVSIVAMGGTGVFQYSADNGNSYLSSSVIGSLPAGDYLIKVKDDANCESSSYPVTLGPSEPFEIDTTEVVRIDASHPGGSISLASTGGKSPVSFVIVPDSSSNTSGVFENLAADDYRLFAMDAGLCKSNELLVSLTEPLTSLKVFDAFSPNGDGKNDVWHIRNIEYYPNCSVKIFNIWGVAVFTSKGYGIPWDGKHNGNDLPSGTYYYVIDPGDGSGTLTGPVSIVK
jgi:gliding motility-associated-like protein